MSSSTLVAALVVSSWACADDTRQHEARCARHQSVLAADRRFVHDAPTMLSGAVGALIPVEDARLVRAAVELSPGSPTRQQPASADRVYVNARFDTPVADLVRWHATLPPGVEARLLIRLSSATVVERVRSHYPELSDTNAAELSRFVDLAQAAPPLVAAVGRCDAAREGLLFLRSGDVDAAGKAVSAGLAACKCGVADLDRFAHLAALLLEPRIAWLPLRDDVLRNAADRDVAYLVYQAAR